MIGIDHHTVEQIEVNKPAICRDILCALPEWFGLPDAIEGYALGVEALPMFGVAADGATIGFLSLKVHTPSAAEAYVLGVKKPWQGQGASRRLFAAAEGWCRERALPFLTVKTLAASHPDPFYARTRAFYAAIGFQPLEVFPTLWSAANPCLLMVKVLDDRTSLHGNMSSHDHLSLHDHMSLRGG
ncbi:MAG TPA: GNAT family N-acetyltransferase [Acetobacteraceae bacterium]|nr:GNAT family N-acetyltransferase [Acetobacteraceae bacterium]